jgi:hypothetical protein
LIYLGWFAVFVFNMTFPLSVAWTMTPKSGRTGIGVAAVALATAGCWICAKARTIGRYLVIGGILIGLTQVFPVLQIIAGVVGMAVGQIFQLIERGDDTDLNLGISELGGLIITLITGSLLMAMSAATGFCLQRFILDPRRRRRAKSDAA